MGNSEYSSGDARKRIRPSGGYRDLRSFQTATIIYDATVSFCDKFIDKRSRLVDQMVQAARSGRQNIAEGSRASATSSQTELRLVSVARASLDELLLDYEDFLRQRGHALWTKDSPHSLRVRSVAGDNATSYSEWLGSDSPEIVANALICLIHQANYLLDRQIAGLEREFITEGGYSERLAAERIAERTRRNYNDLYDQSNPTDPSDSSTPAASPHCPDCGKPMSLRTARTGRNAGSQFWGCSVYPTCKGTRKL